jgi:hypothetical protein
MFLHGCTHRSALPIAMVVGTILSAVNQADVIARGDADISAWVRVVVNYAVPFVVSSLGYLSACRARETTDQLPEVPDHRQ